MPFDPTFGGSLTLSHPIASVSGEYLQTGISYKQQWSIGKEKTG
jgi:hypothetical protein